MSTEPAASRRKARVVQPAISDERFENYYGRLFVHRTSYSTSAVQVTGRTAKRLRVRHIRMRSLHSDLWGSNETIDADWLAAHPIPRLNELKRDGQSAWDSLATLGTDDEQRSDSDDEQKLSLRCDGEWYFEATTGEEFSTVSY